MGKKDTYAQERLKMVKSQLQERNIADPALLRAMITVPRHLFVPDRYKPYSYEDHPLPIGYGQTISQPYIVAYMIEKAKIDPTDKVLEIGTGSGYNAAVLSLLAQDIYTIEIIPQLCQEAQRIFQRLGYTNIHVRQGDGSLGWVEHAPFDVILLTAAPTSIPKPLLEQLKIGGRMILPVGPFERQHLVRLIKTPGAIEQEVFFPVRFVPLTHS